MRRIATCESPFSVDDIAGRIRKSSNFQFEWQFYRMDGFDLRSPIDIRAALESIIANRDHHQFLRDSFVPVYDKTFVIEPLHERSRIEVASGEFEDILARAAGDHLGAYSPNLRAASATEKEEVARVFGQIGPYVAYQLQPGHDGFYNSHLFTNWFLGVAWDWCLLAAWPERGMLWLGCMTDTD